MRTHENVIDKGVSFYFVRQPAVALLAILFRLLECLLLFTKLNAHVVEGQLSRMAKI